jgi:hypothetical protein
METFPGVTFAVHYSRYNMREKNGKPARPKFHVLFPIDHVTNAACYSDMKKLVNAIFPYFDTKALDAARFFFGTTSPEVEIYTGSMNLSEFLESEEFDADMAGGHRSARGARAHDHLAQRSALLFKGAAAGRLCFSRGLQRPDVLYARRFL